MPEPASRSSSSKDDSSFPVPLWALLAVMLVVLAGGAWWLTQTPAEPIRVIPTATPFVIPTATPVMEKEGLAPQTIALGEAQVTVQQTSQPTIDGRVETVSYSSDKDVTFFVLYVVPKETYASATQLIAENSDFADAIILEEDPVLVVPVVLRSGETVKQSMGVKHKQEIAFQKLVIPDDLVAQDGMASSGLLTLKDLKEIAAQLQKMALFRSPAEIASLEKQLADSSVYSSRRVELFKAFLDKSKKEELERAELLFSYINPAVIYNATFIGFGDVLFKTEGSILAPDSSGLADALKDAFSYKKIAAYKQNGLDYSNYHMIFDFRKYISKHHRLPFSGSVPIDLKYSFTGAGQQFSIPLTLTNTDRGRKRLSDYVLVPTAYFFPNSFSQFVPVVNNLPYSVTLSALCVPSTFESQWTSTSPAELELGKLTCGSDDPDDDSRVALLITELPEALSQRTSAPLRINEPISYQTSPNFFVACDEAQDVVESLRTSLFNELQTQSKPDVYPYLLPTIPPAMRATTIIRLADEQKSEQECTVFLDRYDASSQSVTLFNGYSYAVWIEYNLANPSVGVTIGAKEVSRQWEYFVKGKDGVESTFSEDKAAFFSVANSMTAALIPKTGVSSGAAGDEIT